MKAYFAAEENKRKVYFCNKHCVKIPAGKIPSTRAICIVDFMKPSRLIRM